MNGLITPTITAEGELHKVDKANGRYRIRKLTPKECWRLMGFTDEDFQKVRKALNDVFYNGRDKSGSQLYKLAGNSISVPLLEYLFCQIFDEDDNIWI